LTSGLCSMGCGPSLAAKPDEQPERASPWETTDGSKSASAAYHIEEPPVASSKPGDSEPGRTDIAQLPKSPTKPKSPAQAKAETVVKADASSHLPKDAAKGSGATPRSTDPGSPALHHPSQTAVQLLGDEPASDDIIQGIAPMQVLSVDDLNASDSWSRGTPTPPRAQNGNAKAGSHMMPAPPTPGDEILTLDEAPSERWSRETKPQQSDMELPQHHNGFMNFSFSSTPEPPEVGASSAVEATEVDAFIKEFAEEEELEASRGGPQPPRGQQREPSGPSLEDSIDSIPPPRGRAGWGSDPSMPVVRVAGAKPSPDDQIEVVDAFLQEELGDDALEFDAIDLEAFVEAPRPQVIQARILHTPDTVKVQSLGSVGSHDEVEQFFMEEGD